MAATGCSEVEIRAELCLRGRKFAHGVWGEWKKREGEERFQEILQMAATLCQAWWERQGRINLRKKNFQTGCWSANMNNRFGWRNTFDVKSKNMNMNGVPDDAEFRRMFFGLSNGNGNGNGHDKGK